MRRPARRISPSAMRPGGSIRPMIAAPVSDLPAPDSPTTPSTSPGAMVNETSCDGDQRAAPRRELDAQALDGQQRLRRHAAVFASRRGGTTQPAIGST